MTAAWMLYAMLVAGVLGLAARAAESALSPYRLPGRHLWIASMLGSLALPLLTRVGWVRSGPPPAPDGVVALPGMWAAPTATFDRVSALAAPLDAGLLIAWLVTSLLMVAVLGLSLARLARERDSWSPRLVQGSEVLVSPAVGPALIGPLAGAIVVPRWFLDLPPETQRLGLLHEQEHVNAGDTRLLALGYLFLALTPWNPALWWQWSRLRAAIEMDCDTRVLRGDVRPSSYANALLDVGERSRSAWRDRLALVEPRSLLSRRIAAMFPKRMENAWLRAGVSGGAALLLLAVACEAPAPDPVEGNASGAAREVAGPVDLTQVFVAAAVDQPPERTSFPVPEYPRLLLQAGVEGQVTLEAIIDTEGRAEPNSIKVVNSTNRAFEAPAREAMRRALFSPGRVRGRPVRVLVQMPLGFRVGSPPIDAGFVR